MSNTAPHVMPSAERAFSNPISVEIDDEPRTATKSHAYVIESDIMEGLDTEKLVQGFVDISPRRMNLV